MEGEGMKFLACGVNEIRNGTTLFVFNLRCMCELMQKLKVTPRGRLESRLGLREQNN
jgi:hypothetical protein